MTDEVYIHGTNSHILDVLPYTNFTLMSMIDMIQNYDICSYGGEIDRGGYSSISYNCSTCFGTLHKSPLCDYDLSYVLKYTELKPWLPDIISFEKSIKDCQTKAYSNMNIVLIKAQNLLQRGIDIWDKVSQDFLTNGSRIIKIFKTLTYFGSHLRPVTQFKRFSNETDAIYTHITIENLMKTIDNVNIEDVSEISELYELPSTLIIKSGYNCLLKEVNINTTRIFEMNIPHNENKGNRDDYWSIVHRITQNSNYTIGNLLEEYASGVVTDTTWNSLREHLLNHITCLEKCIMFFQSLQCKITKLIPVSTTSIPIILVCRDGKLVQHHKDEYRSIHNLKIGIHITEIATDTTHNQEFLRNYFNEYCINCEVKLISQLL